MIKYVYIVYIICTRSLVRPYPFSALFLQCSATTTANGSSGKMSRLHVNIERGISKTTNCQQIWIIIYTYIRCLYVYIYVLYIYIYLHIWICGSKQFYIVTNLTEDARSLVIDTKLHLEVGKSHMYFVGPLIH